MLDGACRIDGTVVPPGHLAFLDVGRDEITAAHSDWTAGSNRYGTVDSQLPRHHVAPPPWSQR